MRAGLPLRVIVLVLSTLEIRASCTYSPPPLLSHGQGAQTLGAGSAALSGEGGWGATASWWDRNGLGDPEVESGLVGAARARFGLAPDLDVGLVGAAGPERTYVLGPEVKWRFARFAPSARGNVPAFNAALLSGVGVGVADYRYGSGTPRDFFVAPYTGIVASGGIPLIQMWSGLRLAASETLGNGRTDLTFYPVLAYGAELRPTRFFGFYAEGVLAGGVTMLDVGDSALMGYVCGGVTLRIEALGGKPR